MIYKSLFYMSLQVEKKVNGLKRAASSESSEDDDSSEEEETPPPTKRGKKEAKKEDGKELDAGCPRKGFNLLFA